MGANPLKKIFDMITGEEEEEYEEMADTNSQASAAPQAHGKRQRGSLTLLTGSEGGMEIRHPRSLDDRMTIGLDLKQRRIVTLDLTRLPDTEARYFLEFVYGVVFALDATAEKVTEGIYIIAPHGMAVSNDVADSAPATGSTLPSFAVTERGAGRNGQEDLFWPR